MLETCCGTQRGLSEGGETPGTRPQGCGERHRVPLVLDEDGIRAPAAAGGWLCERKGDRSKVLWL